jgi:hypothetical protein
MRKREAQIILKTEERNLLLESGRDGKFVAGRGQERPLGAHAPARGPATGGRTAPMLFFRTTETAFQQP